MASSNITLPSLKSYFLGRKHLNNRPIKLNFTTYKPRSPQSLRQCAKFNLFEILGGRGLCNGEEGLQQELKRSIEGGASKEQEEPDSPAIPTVESIPEEGFEKELMGLTGGFPGGEKGLKLFIEKNPPPEKPSSDGKATLALNLKKPKAPELPLLLPGMIAIVSTPKSPYYMYCGIVQRITDGKAGVLLREETGIG